MVATTILSGKDILALEKAFAKFAKKITDENDKIKFESLRLQLQNLWQMYDPALMIIITRQMHDILQSTALNDIERQTLTDVFNRTHENLLQEKEFSPTERARIMIAYQADLQLFGAKDDRTQASRTWRSYTDKKDTEPTSYHRGAFALAVIKTDHSVMVPARAPSILGNHPDMGKPGKSRFKSKESSRFAKLFDSNNYQYEQFNLVNECLAHPKLQPPGPVSICGLRHGKYSRWNPFEMTGNHRIMDLAMALTKVGYEVEGIGLLSDKNQKILKDLEVKYKDFIKEAHAAKLTVDEEKTPPEVEIGRAHSGRKP